MTSGKMKLAKESKGARDVEDEKKEKLSYPKSILFIISNEFCERFSYYGMRTILVLYFKNRMNYSDNEATRLFHIFAMCCYFTPVLGAIIADSLLGKFLTILIISVVYAAGNILLAVASMDASLALTFIGLGLIALGTGGIKPCVAAFGGDQFLPGQERQLQQFFSFFYVAINSGSLISTFVTPIFREEIKCFDRPDCYPLAFGVPAVLMCVALGLFFLGDLFTKYRKNPPGKENIVVIVCKCIGHALSKKFFSRGPTREHWLDNADDKFEKKTINEVKILMRILFLYIPLPIFWSLFDQQSSRWTLQAVRMNGQLGGITIKPDQIQVINPLLVIGFIPVFQYAIYPLFDKLHFLTTPLKRMTAGGILAGLSFIICGLYQLRIETEQPVALLAGHSHVFFVNGLNCSLKFNMDGGDGGEVTNLDSFGFTYFPNQKLDMLQNKFVRSFEVIGGDPEECKKGVYQVDLTTPPKTASAAAAAARSGGHEEKSEEGDSYVYLISEQIYSKAATIVPATNVLAKPAEGGATIFPVFSLLNYDNYNFTIAPAKAAAKTTFLGKVGAKSYGYVAGIEAEVKGSDISITVANATSTLELAQGAAYVLLVTGDCAQETLHVVKRQVVEENQLSVFLQIIQYTVITFGEIMFSITGYEFSYSQAPKSMKAVIQACWLLTVAFGNLIVAVLADLPLFAEQSHEFFFYGGLMLVDIFIFAIMAYFYRPSELPDEDDDSDDGNKDDDKDNDDDANSDSGHEHIALDEVNKTSHRKGEE